MALRSTRTAITTVAKNILGPDSTVQSSLTASVDDPVLLHIQNLQSTRWWINPTSAGTTANSFGFASLLALRFNIVRPEVMWAFTSGGAATTVVLTAGGQQ
jgi:hypothetical protein